MDSRYHVLLFALVFALFVVPSRAQVTEAELLALQDLWNASSILQTSIPYQNLSQACSWNLPMVFCMRGKILGLRFTGGFSEEMTTLPSSICNMPYLQDISLRLPPLTALPPFLVNCTSLQFFEVTAMPNLDPTSWDYVGQLSGLIAIFISDTPVPTIPSSWTNLAQLGLLELDSTSTVSIPDNFIQNLTTLNVIVITNSPGLSEFPLSSLPSPNFTLPNLNQVVLQGCGFTSIPDVFSAFPQLNYLQLDSNPLLTSLPNSIGSLNHLKQLTAANCSISSLPSLPALSHMRLSLGYNRFTSIPEPVCNLSNPSSIDFSYNTINSAPSCLSNISDIILNLDGNGISDPTFVFSALAGATSPIQLYLGSNGISSQIPSSSLQGLSFANLDLSGNQFTSWPFDIINTNVSSLQVSVLDLSSNQIAGQIPDNATSIFASLLSFSIRNNQLTGSIPSSLFNTTAISVSGNQLSSWPSNLASFTLTSLDVSSNMFSGDPPNGLVLAFNNSAASFLSYSNNPIASSIPANIIETFASVSTASNVQLYFSNCSLNGEMAPPFQSDAPSNPSGQPVITTLDLSYNSIGGPIFASLASWVNPMAGTINFGNNLLSGTLPVFTSQLQSLNVTSNQLTGTIPSFMNITIGGQLFASYNQLNGSIPDLSDLYYVYLAYNSLTGSLPAKFPPQFVANNNQLSGGPVSYTIVNSYVGPIFNVANNSLSGEFTFQTGIGEYSMNIFDISNNKFNGTIPNFGESFYSYLSIAGNEFDLCYEQPGILHSGIPLASLSSLEYLPSICDVTGNVGSDGSTACDCPDFFSSTPCITGCPIPPQAAPVSTPNQPITPTSTSPSPTGDASSVGPRHGFILLATALVSAVCLF